MKWIGICVLIALAALAIGATPSIAAPGGNGNGNGHGGNGNGGDSTAVLTFSPNPVIAGSDYVVIGTGFDANKSIRVILTNSSTPWTSSYFQVVSDASGAFSFLRPGINNEVPGEVVHEAYYYRRNGRYKAPVTSATLLVVAR